MTLVLVPGRSGAWSVQAADSEPADADQGPTRAELNRRQTDIISAFLAGLPADKDSLWKMELGTNLIIDSVHQIGIAQHVADRCVAEPGRRHAFGQGEVEPSAFAVRQTLAGRGLRVSALPLDRARASLTFLLAAIGALSTLLLDLLRFRGTRRDRLPSAPVWFAATGEWSNRTRHLLTRAEPGADLPLLLLGRPRKHDREILDPLERHLPGRTFHLVRPHALSSLPASMGEIMRHLSQGFRAIRCSPHRPALRDLVAIIYRFALGAVSANWWRRNRPEVETVVYGHSCNADTSQLELAQQQLGAVTVHLFHGLSQGHNFAGISDLGVPLCLHDERLHEGLGRYRRMKCFVEDRPPPRAPRAKWLLLTNYANPLNPDFRATGVAIEVAAIDLVAAAAAAFDVAPHEITYRPHPIFASLAEAHRTAIMDRIASAGFAFWPAEQSYEAIADYACVITTPSTAAIDLLRLGRIPVMLDLRGTDAATANGAFPLKATDFETLIEAIRLVGERHDDLFRDAWATIGPARLPELHEIIDAASADRLGAD